jgi:hypothetical protein
MFCKFIAPTSRFFISSLNQIERGKDDDDDDGGGDNNNNNIFKLVIFSLDVGLRKKTNYKASTNTQIKYTYIKTNHEIKLIKQKHHTYSKNEVSKLPSQQLRIIPPSYITFTLMFFPTYQLPNR